MRKAAIDIGTNTVRLLVADYDTGEQFTPVFRTEVITRLGGGFTAEHGIAPEAMQRTITALSAFRGIIARQGVDSVVAVATSVVREAINGHAFVERARDIAGIDITVISGYTEAALATRGALLPVKTSFEEALIFDIGGGSTEFIVTNTTSPLIMESLNLGVVRLTEKYLHHDPPAPDEIAAVERAVRHHLTDVNTLFQKQGRLPFRRDVRAILIGIAGTPTTIAAIDLGLKDYDRERITNHTLQRKRIEAIFQELIGRTAKERLSVPGLQPGREDLIIPGIIITLTVMDVFALEPLRVIDSGILEGIILEKGAIAPYRASGTSGSGGQWMSATHRQDGR